MRKHTMTTVFLGSALAVGVWTIANAGPINPPAGSVTPTSENLNTLNQTINAVAQAVANGNGGPSIRGGSALISMIDGEGIEGRTPVADFSMEILTPFLGGPFGGETARPGLGEVVLTGDGLDAVFVPLAFGAIMGESIAEIRIDYCQLDQNGQPADIGDCVLTIELTNVQVVSIHSQAGSTGEPTQTYSLAAERVQTIYRELNVMGEVVATFVHGWDFAGNRPI